MRLEHLLDLTVQCQVCHKLSAPTAMMIMGRGPTPDVVCCDDCFEAIRPRLQRVLFERRHEARAVFASDTSEEGCEYLRWFDEVMAQEEQRYADEAM